MKAVGGGGGRGMKRVDRLQDLPAQLELAAAEAGAAFGDARVYIERFVAHGRHVEVQVLGDGMGRVIHLGERDCSVQRRYQKLIRRRRRRVCRRTCAPRCMRQRCVYAGLWRIAARVPWNSWSSRSAANSISWK